MKNYTRFSFIACLMFGAHEAFSPLPNVMWMSPIMSTTRQSSRVSSLHASSRDSTSVTTTPADFDYQEMKGLLEAMERQKVPSRYLKKEQRAAIESHVRAVARQRPSAIPLKQIAQVLPGSTWRLGFSTELATLGDLPKDADVILHFMDDTKMDYCLEFSKKTLGLNRLVAKSSYTVDATNLNPGLVTFVYDEIVTDLFGWKGLGVGFFGLLKGRANYIETVFMDTRFWIDRGFSPDGNEYFNVYIRQLADDEQHKKEELSRTTLGDQWD